MKCPSCGINGRLYRSHTNSRFESLIKDITPFKPYRCHDCNWRGWAIRMSDGKTIKLKMAKGRYVPAIIAIIFGIFIAYMMLVTQMD